MRGTTWTKVAIIIFVLAFCCVDYQLSLEEPVLSEINCEEELNAFYERVVEESANETPFKTKGKYVDDKNYLVVGILRKGDHYCIKENAWNAWNAWNSLKCFFIFEDGSGYSVCFSRDEELFSEYDFSSPIGLHLVLGEGSKRYGRHLIKSSRYEVADK